MQTILEVSMGTGDQIELQYIWKYGTPNEVAICMKGAGTSHKDILFKAHLSEKSLLFILNQDLECN